MLRFNNTTRQSVARVSHMPSQQGGPVSEGGPVSWVAWPQVLAFEYLKTMAAATAGAAGVLWGEEEVHMQPLRVLCIGLGGGSLPLFLAHQFPRWQVGDL